MWATYSAIGYWRFPEPAATTSSNPSGFCTSKHTLQQQSPVGAGISTFFALVLVL